MADHKPPSTYLYKKDMMMTTYFPASVLDRVPDFKFYPEDVLIQTYPKSGTTWLTQIIYLILNDCDIETSRKIQTMKKSTFLEMSRGGNSMIDVLERMEPPRLIKTHLPYEFFKGAYEQEGEKGFKAIIGLRNVKDTLVSYYNHHKMHNMIDDSEGFDAFFRTFKARNMLFGDYFDNVLSWWKERSNPNLYFVKYEDLKANPKAEIAKMALFLGKSFKDDELVKIVDECSFDSMKKDPMANCRHLDGNNSKFLRKGMVGDWKNYFTEEQSQYVDLLCEKYLAPHGLEWSDI